jgi:hypothetical protein
MFEAAAGTNRHCQRWMATFLKVIFRFLTILIKIMYTSKLSAKNYVY